MKTEFISWNKKLITNMNKKCKKLVQILLSKEAPATCQELSIEMNVSNKSVRNYIAQINEEVMCITSSNKGYQIDAQLIHTYLEDETADLPENQNDRVTYMLNSMLTKPKNESIDLYDLADEMAVSYETVKKDFILVKKKLSDHDIFVKVNDNFVEIEGSELDKRRFLSSLISESFCENILSYKSLSNIFPDYDIESLSSMIQECCNEYHYFINEYALLNLVLEVVIGIYRISKNFEYISANTRQDRYGIREMQLCKKIVENIEDTYHILYSECEFEELTNILISSLMKIEFSDINLNNLSTFVGSECMNLVNELREVMKNWGIIDVDSEDFVIKFALHIKNLLIRLKNGFVSKNQLTQHIKISCPLIFEYAVEIADHIKRITNYKVDDHEIAFLALHIGCIMGEKDFFNDRITCNLLFPQYYDFTNQLLQNLNAEYNKLIVINKVITRQNEIEMYPCDLVISTLPNLQNVGIEYVCITPFLTSKDRTSIASAVDKIKLKKKKAKLKDYLSKITNEKIFLKNQSFSDSDEVLSFICNRMFEEGYVHEDYLQDIKERERESSTAFGKIAIPHSFKMNAIKTGMFVLLSDHAIPWENNYVNIVLLFAINSDERAMFFNVFDNLVSQLLDASNLAKVLKSETIHDFVDNFIDCMGTE